MKKIPYGIFNYQKLIEQNYYYVDKTMYLERLERVGKTLFYLRPGRFGKTLFTSMMYYYYDVKSESLFENLFHDTYIYQHPTDEKNSYYVLKFDFSGITSAEKSKEELEESFKTCVITGIIQFLSYYHFEYTIDVTKGVSDLIKYFFTFVKELQLDHKLYILIDEYDNFTNAILEGDAQRFKSIVGNEGFIKGFYAAIKEYIGLGVIERFFATGICPITLDSMTTGFNIASDISNDLEFNSMIGLTHEEVKELLNDVVLEKDREEIYQLMIENYDGYLFHKDASERVFNATLVMYLLNYYQRYQSIPESLMDKNIVSNYGKIGNLLKLQNNSYYEEILEQLLKEGNISGELINNFNLLVPFNQDDIISLLYYFGYLTMKEKNVWNEKTVFQIPNKVMKDAYENYFINLVNLKINEGKEEEYYKELFEEGTIHKLTSYVTEIMNQIDNRMFLNFDEKYIQFIYTILLRHNALAVYTEYPCNNGYVDICILAKEDLAKYNVLIELKYLKKKEYNKKEFENKEQEGKTQLENYGKDSRLPTPLKKYLVIFVGRDCKLLEEID